MLMQHCRNASFPPDFRHQPKKGKHMFKKKLGNVYVDDTFADFIACCVIIGIVGLVIWGAAVG